jgi:hypothetical protein
MVDVQTHLEAFLNMSTDSTCSFFSS